MNREIIGRAWVFGDSLDTEAMYPGFAMKLTIPEGDGARRLDAGGLLPSLVADGCPAPGRTGART